MKYWTDIKYKLGDPIGLAIQLLLLLLGIYSLLMAEENRRWKVPVLFIGILSWILLRNKKNHPIIWLVLFALLMIDLYHDYFWVANHHFMLLFMVLSVLLYSYHQRNEILLKNIQILFVVVVLTSAVQKLMSNQFMSGDFYYYMINRGTLFGNFIRFLPESLEIAKSNSKSILDLQNLDPNLGESITLRNIFPNIGVISHIFAWVTVIFELIVAFAILWKSRSSWTHFLILIMIVGILCTRFETGFMALLALSGLFLCQNLYLRLMYVLIISGCIILIFTKLGFH